MENTPEQDSPSTDSPSTDSPSSGVSLTGNSPTLIDLKGLSKVFYTEEVETHALSDIHLDIEAGELDRKSVV